MTANPGRTVQDWTALKIGTAGGSMTNIPVDTIGDIGLDYPEEEMTAFTDVIKGVLVGKPSFSVEVGGPLDNTASTGSHVVLSALTPTTLISFDFQFGIRHAWEAGEPQFGLSANTASNWGACVTKYTVNG